MAGKNTNEIEEGEVARKKKNRKKEIFLLTVGEKEMHCLKKTTSQELPPLAPHYKVRKTFDVFDAFVSLLLLLPLLFLLYGNL